MHSTTTAPTFHIGSAYVKLATKTIPKNTTSASKGKKKEPEEVLHGYSSRVSVRNVRAKKIEKFKDGVDGDRLRVNED